MRRQRFQVSEPLAIARYSFSSHLERRLDLGRKLWAWNYLGTRSWQASKQTSLRWNNEKGPSFTSPKEHVKGIGRKPRWSFSGSEGHSCLHTVTWTTYGRPLSSTGCFLFPMRWAGMVFQQNRPHTADLTTHKIARGEGRWRTRAQHRTPSQQIRRTTRSSSLWAC